MALKTCRDGSLPICVETNGRDSIFPVCIEKNREVLNISVGIDDANCALCVENTHTETGVRSHTAQGALENARMGSLRTKGDKQ